MPPLQIKRPPKLYTLVTPRRLVRTPTSNQELLTIRTPRERCTNPTSALLHPSCGRESYLILFVLPLNEIDGRYPRYPSSLYTCPVRVRLPPDGLPCIVRRYTTRAWLPPSVSPCDPKVQWPFVKSPESREHPWPMAIQRWVDFSFIFIFLFIWLWSFISLLLVFFSGRMDQYPLPRSYSNRFVPLFIYIPVL